MRDKPVLDIHDVEQAFDDLVREYQKLNHLMISLGIDYTNKIAGTVRDKNIFLLRDRINFRTRAILQHTKILIRTQEKAQKALNESDGFPPEGPMVMNSAADNLFALFDSIIFHCSAMLDYIGNTIAFVCLGKKKMKRKWNGVVKSAYAKDNPFSKTQIATDVIRIHTEWIDRLYGHRSKLIHFEPDFGQRTLTYDLVASSQELQIFSPYQFTKHFKELRSLSESHDLTLRYTAFWFTNKFAASACELIESLLGHIENIRTVPEGQEFIQFRPPDNSDAV